MKTLALLFTLATLLVPQVASAGFDPGWDDLRDSQGVHGIDRDGDIPLP